MPGPKVQVRITGHRLDKAALLAHPEFENTRRRFLEAYGELLAEEVGSAVSNTIGSGKWWKSKHPRYGYYRNWVKMRYGSDRARKQQGGLKRRKLSDPMDLQVADINHRADVQRLMVQWLAKKLRNVSVQSTSFGKTRYWITGVRSGHSGPIDITGAVYGLDALIERNKGVRDGEKLGKAERRARNVEEFMSRSGSLTLLGQTKYGQRLLRVAEIEAVREIRRKKVEQTFGSKSTSGASKRVPRTSNHKYAVQTGKLRDAWLDAEGRVRFREGKGARIAIAPVGNGAGIHPARLTHYLKFRIRWQGGDPRLLQKKEVRRVTQTALRALHSQQEFMGVRFRLGKSKKKGR